MASIQERNAIVAMVAGEFVDDPSERNEQKLREYVQWLRDRQGVEALIAFTQLGGDQ